MKTFSLNIFICSVAFSISLFSINPAHVNAAARQEGDICFNWAFGAVEKGGKGAKLLPVTRDTTLNTGDQFKIYLKLIKHCFVYLIHKSSQGEINLLFPYNLKQLDSGIQAPGEYYIPEGSLWFELDEHQGPETFYLLASSSRLLDLESHIHKYESADEKTQTELAEKVLTEIRRLRWKHRKFKTFAERPVNILGSHRGADAPERVDNADIASLAVEISAEKFFSRAFTIDHK